MSQQEVVLLLGSNLGNTKENIDAAISSIEASVGKIKKRTNYLETIPVEYDSCNIFCNIAITITTIFSPVKLLEKLKEIEREQGRERDSAEMGGYEDRIIDIDIIYYSSLIYKCNRLKIPHIKHVKERDFSIKLLSELIDEH